MALTGSIKPASNRACFSRSSLSASSALALAPFLWNMASSDQNSSLSDFYFGGCNSPRNQPTASDFIGSIIRRYGDLFDVIAFGAVESLEFKSCRRPRRGARKLHTRAAFWAAELLNCKQWDCGWVICHCIPPLQAGAQHSQSPGEAERGAGGIRRFPLRP